MKYYLPDSNSTLDSYRIFSDVEYIVSDIDGTLTLGSAPIIEQIKKKTNRLKRKKVMTTIATGRPYSGAYNVIQQLGIELGMPLVVYNGGVLIEHNTGRIIKEYVISEKSANRIISIVSKENVGIYVYTCDVLPFNMYNILNQYRLKENVYYAGSKKKSVDINGKKVKMLTGECIRNEKIVSMLIERKSISSEIYNQVMRCLESDSEISSTDSGNGFIEIRAIQDKKSIVIDELKDRCIMKKNMGKILAIGDNDNDVDMLKAADISVAVANSSLEAIKVSDYLCGRNSAEGYLDMLTVVENAKKYFKQ